MSGSLATGVVGGKPALAATATAVCTVSGTATFSPGLASTVQTTTVSLTMTGSCTSSQSGASAMTLSGSGNILGSCAAAEGTMQLSFYFNSPLPPLVSTTADAVWAPGALSLAIEDPSVTVPGGAELVSPSLSPVGCVGGGLTSAPLIGSFAVVYLV